MKALLKYHPFTLLILFFSIVGLTMFFQNPVYFTISIVGSFLLLLKTQGFNHHKKSILFSFVLIIFLTLINPFFSKAGLTVLLFINDMPVTLESLIYGFAFGVMLVAVFAWSVSISNLLTDEKIIYLFKYTPTIALLISMTLRLVPKAKKQLKEINNSITALGMRKSSWLNKIKLSLKAMSALITWLLENGIDTTFSMNARGYGKSKRTSYQDFKFKINDFLIISLTLILVVIIVTGEIFSVNSFYFYPILKLQIYSNYSLICYVTFFILTMLPTLAIIKEDIKWRFYQLKI